MLVPKGTKIEITRWPGQKLKVGDQGEAIEDSLSAKDQVHVKIPGKGLFWVRKSELRVL